MSNNHIPIEAYPAHYLEFLKQAALAEGGKVIPIGEGDAARKKATSTRAAINLLRSKCKKENHPIYEKICHVMMTVEQIDGKWCLVGKIRGSGVVDAFEAAGIKPETLSNDPLNEV